MKGKTCIITGGSSGIGRAMCLAFAKEGCHVVNLDIDVSKGRDLEATELDVGGSITFMQLDVTDHENCKEVIGLIAKKRKSIDIVINNAGIAYVGKLEETDPLSFHKLYEVNVKGVYNILHASIQHLKESAGTILNISSIAATVALPDRFLYSLTKAAVENMTYTIARDYLEHGIRCNSIAPARVHTPFVDQFIAKNYPGKEAEIFEQLSKTQPIGRMGQPKEVADLAVYLCSEKASFITGSNFPIDGGFIKLNT